MEKTGSLSAPDIHAQPELSPTRHGQSVEYGVHLRLQCPGPNRGPGRLLDMGDRFGHREGLHARGFFFLRLEFLRADSICRKVSRLLVEYSERFCRNLKNATMKKFPLIIFLFLSISVFNSKPAQAMPWMDEMTVFCIATIEWQGGPFDVRGTKDTCYPSSMSWCNVRRCEALTRPVQ